MMWITIRNIVLIQYRNNNKKKKKIVFGAILNLESLVEAVENLTVCWSWSRCGYVHWRWSCELILQSVVTHVLSINKERQELSHDNGGVCFDFFFFFSFGKSTFHSVYCAEIRVCSVKRQCQVTTTWQWSFSDCWDARKKIYGWGLKGMRWCLLSSCGTTSKCILPMFLLKLLLADI